MKRFLIFLLLGITATYSNAQISSYYSYDNVEDAVYLVEEMSQEEIKVYNQFVEGGYSNKKAVVSINVGRAYTNLRYAPATIICYTSGYYDEDNDYLSQYDPEMDAMFIYVYLINSAPKTIKDITLYFRFAKQGKELYDIKTGEKYCILKYENLSGRIESTSYEDIAKTIMGCYHALGFNDAVYKQTFHNKLADTVILDKVEINYADGTHSTEAACFEGDNLFLDGPLKPINDAMNYFKNN